MQDKRLSGLLAMAALAGMASASAGSVSVLRPLDSGYPPPHPRNDFRRGRRTLYPVRKGGNPAGTKFARAAAESRFGLSTLR